MTIQIKAIKQKCLYLMQLLIVQKVSDKKILFSRARAACFGVWAGGGLKGEYLSVS